MDTLEEIISTTHDEYGMKAAGFLQSLVKFNTLFGLRLAHILFCAAEQVSFVLQKKGISLSDALSAVGAAKAYYHRLRSEEEFDHFFDATVQFADKHNIGKPEAPRYSHDLKTEVDLMSFHLLEPTIARLSLKLVIFYLWS